MAGCLFITRQNYTDHRDLRKALISAEMTGMIVLGFVFYGEDLLLGGNYGYYSKKNYQKYYKDYYSRNENQVETFDEKGLFSVAEQEKTCR